MRLNIEQFRYFLSEKQLTDEYARKAAGLSNTTYQWLLNGGGGISCETIEAFAETLECAVGDILLPDYEGFTSNVIEWERNAKIATLSLSQRKFIGKVKRLAEKYPEQVQIMAENKDGSLYAHMPVEWAVKMAPTAKRTEKQRAAARINMFKIHQTATK